MVRGAIIFLSFSERVLLIGSLIGVRKVLTLDKSSCDQ